MNRRKPSQGNEKVEPGKRERGGGGETVTGLERRQTVNGRKTWATAKDYNRAALEKGGGAGKHGRSGGEDSGK